MHQRVATEPEQTACELVMDTAVNSGDQIYVGPSEVFC